MMRKILIIGTLLAACGAPTWLDEGLMVRDGLELHIDRAPRTVCAAGELDHPDIISEAIAWSNSEVDFTLFAQTACPADIEVEQGLVPGDLGESEELDVTTVSYDETGLITHVSVVLSADQAYDRPTMLQALKHCLFHGIGLEDDPGPPETVDLRSVMSKPLDPWGSLTAHDRDIIREMLGVE